MLMEFAERALAPRLGWLILVLLVLLACACRETPGTNTSAGPLASKPSPATSTRRPEHAPLLDERVAIPGGEFQAGSVPGEVGRNPELEPRRYAVELGPFEIDRLPYPNDPGKPARTSVTREEARRACAERDARLCTELEWERACKGPNSDAYPGGSAWEARCASDAKSCASGYDVLALGSLREWVANDVSLGEDVPRRAVIRGAPASAPAAQHRCAQRSAADSTVKSDDLGFRCCKGAPNAAVIPEAKLGQTFRRARIDAAQLSKLLASHERTRALAKDVKFFREPDATNTVLERGPGDRKGFSFTVAPLIWNPVAGAEFLLVSGRSGEKDSFVLAFHVLSDDEFQLASSFVMKGEPGPVAFAYSGYIRPRLHFSTCWGCPGETGKILYRDPDSVIIVQP
jgi:hypothetical protein